MPQQIALSLQNGDNLITTSTRLKTVASTGDQHADHHKRMQDQKHSVVVLALRGVVWHDLAWRSVAWRDVV